MFSASLNLTSKAAPWALWAWNHRDKIQAFPKDAESFVTGFLENGGESIQRVGSSIVFGTPDGGRRVLGFIDQTSVQMENIEAAITGVQTAQSSLASSVASLQTISMVTLGLSAVTPVILAAQFRYLSKQFEILKKEIRDLRSIVEQQAVAKLRSGLDVLESGVAKSNRSMIENSMMPCNESLHFFSGRVGDAVADGKDRQLVLYLSRHLSVAACASARCLIALEYDDTAEQTIEAHRDILIAATKHVFRCTAGKDPSRFLTPQLSSDVSIDFIKTLFQQALEAGLAEGGDESMRILRESTSTSRLFESLRPRLFRPNLDPFGVRNQSLKAELHQAAASVEETNRVLSLRTFLAEAKKAGVKAIEAVHQIDQEKQSSGSPFVAWSF